jgi:hypothetical protein
LKNTSNVNDEQLSGYKGHVETTGPGFKISGNTINEIPDKNRNYVQTDNTTEVPYKFVNSGTHCDIKKGAQTSKQCTGQDNLPRIQIPGNTMHRTPNKKKQELHTDRQHKCQNQRKIGSIPEHMNPKSKDRDFNTW